MDFLYSYAHLWLLTSAESISRDEVQVCEQILAKSSEFARVSVVACVLCSWDERKSRGAAKSEEHQNFYGETRRGPD